MFYFFEPASVFARGGRPKIEKTLAGSKNQKLQKALVTEPWQASKKQKKHTRIYGGLGGVFFFGACQGFCKVG